MKVELRFGFHALMLRACLTLLLLTSTLSARLHIDPNPGWHFDRQYKPGEREQQTRDAETLLRLLRKEQFHVRNLDTLDSHPIIRDAEIGNLGMDTMERFVGEQYYMIKSDLRSLAHLFSRYADTDNGDFWRTLLRSETISLNLLLKLAKRLGLSESLIRKHEPAPGAQALPSFVARLSHYSEDAEVAAVLAISYPTWRIITRKLQQFLVDNYGFNDEDIAFLNYFSSPQPGFEEAARRVIDVGLSRGLTYDKVRTSLRLMEGYHIMFWDSVYQGRHGKRIF